MKDDTLPKIFLQDKSSGSEVYLLRRIVILFILNIWLSIAMKMNCTSRELLPIVKGVDYLNTIVLYMALVNLQLH